MTKKISGVLQIFAFKLNFTKSGVIGKQMLLRSGMGLKRQFGYKLCALGAIHK